LFSTFCLVKLVRLLVNFFSLILTYSHIKFPLHYTHLEKEGSDSRTVWPDSKLGPLAPKDMRLPYPGHIGLECNLKSTEPTLEELSRDKKILLDDISFWAKLVHQPSRQSEQVQVWEIFKIDFSDFPLIIYQ